MLEESGFHMITIKMKDYIPIILQCECQFPYLEGKQYKNFHIFPNFSFYWEQQ